MTVRELIEELKNYPKDMPVLTAGFRTPTLNLATVWDFDIEASRKADAILRNESSACRVLSILGGDSVCEDIDVNGYPNHQPHFIQYDYDGIQRS